MVRARGFVLSLLCVAWWLPESTGFRVKRTKALVTRGTITSEVEQADSTSAVGDAHEDSQPPSAWSLLDRSEQLVRTRLRSTSHSVLLLVAVCMVISLGVGAITFAWFEFGDASESNGLTHATQSHGGERLGSSFRAIWQSLPQVPTVTLSPRMAPEAASGRCCANCARRARCAHCASCEHCAISPTVPHFTGRQEPEIPADTREDVATTADNSADSFMMPKKTVKRQRQHCESLENFEDVPVSMETTAETQCGSLENSEDIPPTSSEHRAELQCESFDTSEDKRAETRCESLENPFTSFAAGGEHMTRDKDSDGTTLGYAPESKAVISTTPNRFWQRKGWFK